MNRHELPQDIKDILLKHYDEYKACLKKSEQELEAIKIEIDKRKSWIKSISDLLELDPKGKLEQ